MHHVDVPEAVQSTDQPSTATASSWREVVDRNRDTLIDELSAVFDFSLKEHVSLAIADERRDAAARLDEARAESRRVQAESLNQVLRGIRQATDSGQILRF